MSKHVELTLHLSEETVTCALDSALIEYVPTSTANPITDYFSATSVLIKKIVNEKYPNDSEILGLLVLGVVSCAEFYFRSVLSVLGAICPLCEVHSESVNIPLGSIRYYSKSGFPTAMATFEHSSLADMKAIANEIKRFAGFNCMDDSSVKRALQDFEILCEVRHCFVHTRGFVGLKAARAIGGKRALQKLLIQQTEALDLIKFSHNAVRAVNRYLANQILTGWIDGDVLAGDWVSDRESFTRLWKLFAIPKEDEFAGSVRKAYAKVRQSVLKRRQAIAAKVRTTS